MTWHGGPPGDWQREMAARLRAEGMNAEADATDADLIAEGPLFDRGLMAEFATQMGVDLAMRYWPDPADTGRARAGAVLVRSAAMLRGLSGAAIIDPRLAEFAGEGSLTLLTVVGYRLHHSGRAR